MRQSIRRREEKEKKAFSTVYAFVAPSSSPFFKSRFNVIFSVTTSGFENGKKGGGNNRRSVPFKERKKEKKKKSQASVLSVRGL